jgi:hypothetical protein
VEYKRSLERSEEALDAAERILAMTLEDEEDTSEWMGVVLAGIRDVLERCGRGEMHHYNAIQISNKNTYSLLDGPFSIHQGLAFAVYSLGLVGNTCSLSHVEEQVLGAAFSRALGEGELDGDMGAHIKEVWVSEVLERLRGLLKIKGAMRR